MVKGASAVTLDDKLRRALRQTLQCAELAGVDMVATPAVSAMSGATTNGDLAPDSQMEPAAGQTDDATEVTATAGNDSVVASRVCPTPDVAALLDVIRQEVGNCTCCAELAARRTQTVFGVGNPKARLCLLGEAPGADEDRLGEPFVGRAGQLLDKILTACKLTREDVYILNVLKCRPPQNRTPALEEVENCRQFFERQLDLIQPEFICCLGAVAASSLLRTKSPLGRLRGQFHDWRGIQVLVTYHPAYLLRNPAAKADTWKDMQMLMQAMGIALT